MTSTPLIAHRGAPERHPENTIPSFETALSAVDVLELDVRATRDAVLVCTHDRSLQRTHGVDRRVGELTWEELQQLAPEVPRVEEVLERFGDQAGWFVDCKVSRPRTIDALLELVERLGLRWEDGSVLRAGGLPSRGACVFEHSDAAIVQHVHSRTGGACIELVSSRSTGLELALTAPFISAYAHGVALPDVLATPRMLRLLRTLRLGSYVYTVNDIERIAQLGIDGASAVFTDDVTR